MTFTVRPITKADAPACTELLNHTIALGGTTAYETPYTEDGFDAHYREEAALCHVVLFEGRVIGFQGAFAVGNGDLSIGSFTDQRNPVKGAGRALFEETVKAARAAGFSRILAKITEDNAPGLAYYSRMGFEDFEIERGGATRNGKAIDRVIKAYPL